MHLLNKIVALFLAATGTALDFLSLRTKWGATPKVLLLIFGPPLFVYLSLHVENFVFSVFSVPALITTTLSLAAASYAAKLLCNQPNRSIHYFALAPILYAIGDLLYAIANYWIRLPVPNTLKSLTYVVPYTFGMFLCARALYVLLLRVSTNDRGIRKVALLAFILIFTISYVTIAHPALFYKTPQLHPLLRILAVTYTILEAVIISIALTLLLGARGIHRQIFLTGIIVMHVTDLALRYQSLHPELMGFSIFEMGWLLGITQITLSLHGVLDLGTPTNGWIPLHSLRSRSILLCLCALLVLAFGLTSLFVPPNDSRIAAIAILLFLLSYLVALAIGTVSTNELDDLNSKLSSNSTAIRYTPNQNPPYEIRLLIDEFQKLFSTVVNEQAVTKKMAHLLAHDLGSPLSALRTVPIMINDAVKDCTTCKDNIQEASDALRLVDTSIRRISADLLKHRKQQALVPNVKAEVLEAIKICKLGHPNRTLESIIDVSTDGPPAAGLSRVILNLINNGFEASDPEFPVTLRLSGCDKHISVSVRDRGKGISPDILRQIESGSSVTTKINGNGIGLRGMLDWATNNSAVHTILSSPESGTEITITMGTNASA